VNGLFGGKKNKYAVSEPGVSDTNSSHIKSSSSSEANSRYEIKPQSLERHSSDTKSSVSVAHTNEGRPPKMPDSNKRRGPETIRAKNGEAPTVPSTPGNQSTCSIPPPRHVPSTPGGASVFSEFRSVAGSAYTGVASSTFDPQAHERALRKMQKIDASLGANALDNAMPVYYEDDDRASTVAPSSVAQPAIAYDVFAPAGAIGIVVDTTDKGCIVHSLKKTSPMQGLMNPGDLIVALDDFDVRKMSAASLTKLMAKKSQQPERKFTLVPADYV
jgi:hypothetical protein